MFAQCDQWKCSREQSVTLKSREIISTIIIKENKFGEKAKRFSQKTRTHSSVGIVALYLIEGRIMHAEEFVLIPKRMFISKNPTTEEIFDNPRKKYLISCRSVLQWRKMKRKLHQDNRSEKQKKSKKEDDLNQR